MISPCRWLVVSLVVLIAIGLTGGPWEPAGSALARTPTIFPYEPQPPAAALGSFDLVLLGDKSVTRPTEQGTFELAKDPADGSACFVVRQQQAGMRIDEPAFVGPKTTIAWSWKKQKGQVAIVQVGLRNPESGQLRYFGYAAGTWSEPPSSDPTVEQYVSRQLPTEWTTVERPIYDDIRKVLGWSGAQIVSFYASPWDGEPGSFRNAVVHNAARGDVAAQGREAELHRQSQIAKGHYLPSRLKRADEERVAKFGIELRGVHPGPQQRRRRWSAFGAIGNLDFNCMGRRMWVRYPAFELVFRLYDGTREIMPGDLESFRLGLVDNRLPAVWGGWEHEGLLYKVSAMTVPSGELGNFDLYRLDIQNIGARPAASKLVAAIDGPPDLRLEHGIVRRIGTRAVYGRGCAGRTGSCASRLGTVRQAREVLRYGARTRED